MQYVVKKKVLCSAEKSPVNWAEPNSRSSAKQFCRTKLLVGHYSVESVIRLQIRLTKTMWNFLSLNVIRPYALTKDIPQKNMKRGWSHSVYIRTVRPWLMFSSGTFDSFLAALGSNWVYSAVHVALLKRPIYQFKPVWQRRQHDLWAYCPYVNTVIY